MVMYSRCSRPLRRIRGSAQVLLLSGLLVHLAGASADDALQGLRQVVDEACQCAAAQPSGMNAAVSCTEGPRAFGSLKVDSRDGWNAAERAEADILERVIETCIANALDHATARERLGLAAVPGTVGAAPMVWMQVRVADLGAHPAKLARIHVDSASPLKGLVESVTTEAVLLRLARRDGGGTEAIPIEQIREAWVMALP